MEWIIIALLVLIIALGIVAYLMRNKEKKPVDYYSIFILGLVWTIMGIFSIISDGYSTFFTLGFVFMGVGLIHKGEWKKNNTLKNMTKGQKKLTIILIVILTITFIVGIVILLLKR